MYKDRKGESQRGEKRKGGRETKKLTEKKKEVLMVGSQVGSRKTGKNREEEEQRSDEIEDIGTIEGREAQVAK